MEHGVLYFYNDPNCQIKECPFRSGSLLISPKASIVEALSNKETSRSSISTKVNSELRKKKGIVMSRVTPNRGFGHCALHFQFEDIEISTTFKPLKVAFCQ